MKLKEFILLYFICFLTWLSQSHQSCINRPKQTGLQEQNDNSNIFELITKLRGEMIAEKRRFTRYVNAEYFLGSNLFDGIRKKCFSAEEVRLLQARVEFEQMIPLKMRPMIMSDRQIKDILRYFSYGHFLINRLKKDGSNDIMKKAFYDTVGGFLHFYLIPIAKASFYAGRVKVDTCFKVFAHYEKCRNLLNTNGNGWRMPDVDPLKHLGQGNIKPLRLRFDGSDSDEEAKYCRLLDLASAANDGDIIDDKMLVCLPKIDIEDTDGYLGNICFPYERKRTFNLKSPNSACTLVQFYKTVIGCYNEKGISPSVYQAKLRDWIIERVQIHLNDEVFYPGFASVLRLYESVRQPGQKNKCKRKKKNKISFGDRQKRGGGEIEKAPRQERSKSYKFINLENKCNRILPEMLQDDCSKNWLDDPIITGKSKPEESKPEENCDQTDVEKKVKKPAKSKLKKSRQKNKKKDKEKSKTKSNKNKESREKEKKRKWSFGRLFKKETWRGMVPKFKGLGKWKLFKNGTWGGIFPNLKGLSFPSKIWQIFKFLFFFILFLFAIIFFVKICSVCCIAGASPAKCCEYVTRALVGFLKVFLNVLSAMCGGCARLCCVKISKSKEPPPKNQVMVIVNSKKQKREREKSGQLPPMKSTMYFEDTKESKDELKPAKKQVKNKHPKKEKSEPFQEETKISTTTLKNKEENKSQKPVLSSSESKGQKPAFSSSETDENEERTQKSKKKKISKKGNKKSISAETIGQKPALSSSESNENEEPTKKSKIKEISEKDHKKSISAETKGQKPALSSTESDENEEPTKKSKKKKISNKKENKKSISAETKSQKPALSSTESNENEEPTKKSKKKFISKKDNKKPIKKEASKKKEPNKQKKQEVRKHKKKKCGCFPVAEKCDHSEKPLIKQPIKRKKSRAERKIGRGRKRIKCDNTNPDGQTDGSQNFSNEESSDVDISSHDSNDQKSAYQGKNDDRSSWKTFYDF